MITRISKKRVFQYILYFYIEIYYIYMYIHLPIYIIRLLLFIYYYFPLQSNVISNQYEILLKDSLGYNSV